MLKYYKNTIFFLSIQKLQAFRVVLVTLLLLLLPFSTLKGTLLCGPNVGPVIIGDFVEDDKQEENRAQGPGQKLRISFITSFWWLC